MNSKTEACYADLTHLRKPHIVVQDKYIEFTILLMMGSRASYCDGDKDSMIDTIDDGESCVVL